MTNIRLKKEYQDLIKNPPIGVTAGMENNSLYEWIATLSGPTNTPYYGGLFTLKLTFPQNYPFAPPKITFVTPIYHCNINSNGEICLDILKDTWTPALTIEKVLLSISSLLADPNPNDPLVPEIAQLYKSYRIEHDINAKTYTLKYA